MKHCIAIFLSLVLSVGFLTGCASAPATVTQPVVNVQPAEQEQVQGIFHTRVSVAGVDSVSTMEDTASLSSGSQPGSEVTIERAARDADGNIILVDGAPVFERVTASGVREIVMGNVSKVTTVTVAPAGTGTQGQATGQEGSGAPNAEGITPTATTNQPVDVTPPPVTGQ